MKRTIKKYAAHYTVICLTALLGLTSCEKYLENTSLPAGTIAGTDAFISDNAISGIVAGNYINLNANGLYSGGTGSNITNLLGFYTDELKPPPVTTTPNSLYYTMALTSANGIAWSNWYSKIYTLNSALEGIQKTTAQLYFKNQWLGECYFLRAFAYYHLVNLYGDVPLALTSDFTTNNTLSRTPASQVYDQIIADCKQAQSLLSTDYKDGYGNTTTSSRVRPNQYAAGALLARAYLYAGKYDSAEVQATTVINNSSLYKMEALSNVFLSSSKEAIWQLATTSEQKTYEYAMFNNGMPATIAANQSFSTYSIYAAISDWLLNAFETGDARYTTWVRSGTLLSTTPNSTYYFPNKFRSATGGVERTTILRLAEMYLIRAEARARQNNISGAQADLNVIRTRASLSNTTASNVNDLIKATLAERRIELFSENGHRFFDLKRTGTIDSVMTVVAPGKNATWASYKQLWPIAVSDMTIDPNITPNPGY